MIRSLRLLHDFIVSNRDQIIDRARQRARERTAPKLLESKLEHGIPLFLTQLADALVPVAPPSALHLVGALAPSTRIGDSAALHGRELLRTGFTVAQVVHGYGDVCQIVTELASEMNAAITAQDFHVFNRCLDDAIAGAVTAYGRQRERDIAFEGTERLGVLAHELRNILHTAILSFDVIKRGMVGVGGSTGAVHSRSLAGLRSRVERSLAEVRLQAGMPTMLERVSVLAFIEEIEISAAMEAEGYGFHLTVGSVDSDVTIDADWQLLTSAVTNLLQNAFKFTRRHGHISLTTLVTEDRVLIEVADECGGLPAGKAEELFRPFTRGSSSDSGLGLGLSIALRAARANSGDIRVRDVPGTGCVFTIDLPRQRPPEPVFHVLPHADPGSPKASGRGPRRGAHSRKPKARAM
jgi:signal transduction histidine kinase